mgnify:FL=1
MGCFVYSLHWLRAILVARRQNRDIIYLHLRGAFSVARFDRHGNAKAYESWNEQQTGSTLFCICT